MGNHCIFSKKRRNNNVTKSHKFEERWLSAVIHYNPVLSNNTQGSCSFTNKQLFLHFFSSPVQYFIPLFIFSHIQSNIDNTVYIRNATLLTVFLSSLVLENPFSLHYNDDKVCNYIINCCIWNRVVDAWYSLKKWALTFNEKEWCPWLSDKLLRIKWWG